MKYSSFLLLILAFISTDAFAQEDRKIEDGTGKNYNVIMDRQAEYPGGNKAMYMEMYQLMEYPVEAKEKRVEGDIQVSFNVMPDSTTGDVRALGDLGYGTKAEAERIVKQLKFIPAIQNGKAIKQHMMLPVMFRIYE